MRERQGKREKEEEGVEKIMTSSVGKGIYIYIFKLLPGYAWSKSKETF